MSLLEALGQSGALAELVSRMRVHAGGRFLVTGASGTGKTSFANQAALALRQAGSEVIQLRGDFGRRKQEHYPVLNMLRARARMGESRALLAAAAGDLPWVGNLARKAVDLVGEHLTRKALAASPALADPLAAEFIAFLRGRLKRRPILLVLDDIQAFDAATLRTLYTVLADQTMLGSYANRLSILATLNEDELQDSGEEGLDRLLAPFKRIQLLRATEAQFPFVLKALGINLPDAPLELIRDLYRRSGGHLRVLAEIAHYIEDVKAEEVQLLAGDLLEIALRTRLAETDAASRTVRQLLMRLAIVGTTFTRSEAYCIYQDNPGYQLTWALDRAEALHLIQREGAMLQFEHSSIRSFFLDAAGSQFRKLHEVFAGCLRILRPSDYTARAHHLSEAGDHSYADCLAVLSWARANRAGRAPLLPSLNTVDYSDYMSQIRSAHGLMHRGDYDGARAALEVIHDSYPVELLAERDLTIVECLLEDIRYVSARSALRLIEGWPARLHHEPELRFRALYLLAMAHVLLGEYQRAHQFFSELQRFVAAIRGTDPGIQRMLNRVQLVSDCLHKIEVAGGRIYSALELLLRAEGAGGVFNPLDLYIALTNYSGNRLIAGEYEDAAHFADRALRLRDEYEYLGLPAGEAALNNHLLADLLSERASTEETFLAYARLHEHLERPLDNILLCVNYANVALLTGRISEALTILESVRPLPTKGIHDEYYVYYANHAYAVALLVSGRREVAERLWVSLAQLIENQPPGVREYLSLRHQLLGGALRDPLVESVKDWDTYLSQVPEQRGRPWRFFRRGLLFTDIQVWFHL